MTEWEPATEAEAAMRDALRAGDQELYFRILARTELLLPVSVDALAGRAPMGWGTWTTGGRTHVLAFTSAPALQACLAENAGSTRRIPYHELAGSWPNLEWWLAVNPGLPIEGYLPAWFVSQLARGDVRLPGRSLGSRGRLDRIESAASARATAAVPRRSSPMDPAPAEPPAAPAAPFRPPPAAPAAPFRPPPAAPAAPFRPPPADPVSAPPAAPVSVPVVAPTPDRGNGGGDFGGPISGDASTGWMTPAGQTLPGRPNGVSAVAGYRPTAPADPELPDATDGSQSGWYDAANPFSADPVSTEPFPAEPFPADPFPADPFPAEPFPAEPFPAEPFPAEPFPAEPFPADPVAADPVTAAPVPTAPFPTDPVPDRQLPSDFVPANDVEQSLLDAAGDGSTDTFLSTLLLARVLLPVAATSAAGARPGDDGFDWRTEFLDGETYVVVFTSPERLKDHLAEPVETIAVKFVQLIRAWPDNEWSFAVNPGTPVGAKLPGVQIVALANWAAEVGLGDEADIGDQPQAAPAEEEAPRSTYAPAREDPGRPTMMQKTIASSQLSYYLDRGYDRVSGFVHRASEIAHLCTPAKLHAALGLGYPGSLFARDADEVYVLRWPAYRPSLYRIPYGGQTEAAMRAMEGWVIERPPFRGNGFAPGESSDVVAEFKVDSIRLPHGAQLWRVGADGTERLVATLDCDVPAWRQVGEE